MANQGSGKTNVRSSASRCGRTLRVGAAFLASLAALAALGCTTPLTPPPLVEAPPDYRVGAPDSLAISILPEPTIEAQVAVRPDGMITVPLIGDLRAGGRTIPEIASEIEERIARYKRDAKVTVALAAAQSTGIVVLGEVGHQGSFPLVKQTRAAEAIAMVGGTTAFSSDRRIRVIRTTDRVTRILRVNLVAIQSGDLSTNLLLEPGDIVYVPPTLWARFGYALNTLLFPFQPIMGMARTVGGNLLTP